ncbi:hypothetical protein [uncultured Marinobacter sp.]|uniref:hypothetical protein n=1 Tax=uncultured Marinobacter sp. TaxID=187379 RepID=UPI0030D94DED
MPDIHIEEFYRDAAIALLQLYSVFPRRINLFVEDIAGPDDPDEFGLHSPRHQACFGALLWLQEEGLLRYIDTIRQEALDQAVLTQRAFVRLSMPAPEAIHPDLTLNASAPPVSASLMEDRSTFIYLLREAIHKGSATTVGKVMREAFFHEPMGPASNH